MALTRKAKEIKPNKLFTGATESIIKSVFKPDEFIEVAEGEIIYQTGDEADSIYLIIKGEAKIKFPSHHYISKKNANDFFGEKELYDNTRRNSSAVANSYCLLYLIPAEKFKSLLRVTDIIEKNINTYGEVVLPEMEQTSQSKINLTNPDKPVSFKANVTDAEKINTEVVKKPDFQSPGKIVDEQISSEIPELEIDGDINILDENQISAIKPDTPANLPEDKFPKNFVEGHIQDLSLNNSVTGEILNALLIIHNQLTVYDTIQSVLIALQNLLASDAGEIFIVNENAGEMGRYIDEGRPLKMDYHKISDGLTGTCVLQRKILNFDEPTEDSRFITEIDQPGESGLKKILYVPLISESNIFVGVLQLARKDKMYSESEINKVQLISNQIALAIERGKLFEQKLGEEKHNSNRSIYSFLEDNISIPADIIYSYASILKRGQLSAKDKSIVSLLQLQADFFHNIIESVFDINKSGMSLNLNKANLSTFLLGASELLSEYCEARNISLFRNTEASANVKFDSGRLFMAIYQLIKNACDASEKNGKVFISLQSNMGFAQIIISDEGSGIEDSRKKNLFNSDFDTNKGRNRFGLAMTKRIVDLHSGKIEFSSVENEGSIFTISLPLVETEEVPSLLDHFEPAFELDESANDFSEYLSDEYKDLEESSE